LILYGLSNRFTGRTELVSLFREGWPDLADWAKGMFFGGGHMRLHGWWSVDGELEVNTLFQNTSTMEKHKSGSWHRPDCFSGTPLPKGGVAPVLSIA
jgi:hypothetical protein